MARITPIDVMPEKGEAPRRGNKRIAQGKRSCEALAKQQSGTLGYVPEKGKAPCKGKSI